MQQVPQAQQSPSMVAAMQAQARTSPFQAAGHQRTHSRQSQRAQSGMPKNADQSTTRGFHPPGQSRPVNQASNDLVASSNYNNYGRYLGTNTAAAEEQQGNRIAYEPISQQQTTAPAASSYPAHDYGRSSTSTNMAQSFNPSNSNNMTTASQWSGSQSRSSQSYDKPSGYSTSSYAQPAPSSHSSASLHNFGMRASAQKRPSSGAAAMSNKQPQQPQQPQQQPQQQQSNYPHYSSQSQSHDQQMGQHGGWNYFGPNGQGWL